MKSKKRVQLLLLDILKGMPAAKNAGDRYVQVCAGMYTCTYLMVLQEKTCNDC